VWGEVRGQGVGEVKRSLDVWPDRHSYPDKIPTPVLTVQTRFRHALLPVQILIHSKTHSSGILQFYPSIADLRILSWGTETETDSE